MVSSKLASRPLADLAYLTGDPEYAHIQVKTTTKKVILNGKCFGAGNTAGYNNLDDMCWQQNNFTPVLRAWAARESIVLYVFGDKAYARITDLPAAEEHLKFVVTGRNKQVKPVGTGDATNYQYEPTPEFRSQRGRIENSFRDLKVNRRFSGLIDPTSAYHLDSETTVTAVVQNLMLPHRNHSPTSKKRPIAAALEKDNKISSPKRLRDKIPPDSEGILNFFPYLFLQLL